jgi:nucleotide-binding universal stress UspA family protein
VQYVEPVFESPDSARRHVGAIVERLRTRDVVARSAGLAGMGGVAREIASAAERVDADVIVVGSRRRRSLPGSGPRQRRS